ncbi:hypothetical protein H4Q26_010160 [Puccinia striiformis f. sp. tritici PST-130]|nr:hypothetical protein H4Q26_010160 [Puccinia striiformis f. sp. tritici PST-130]
MEQLSTVPQGYTPAKTNFRSSRGRIFSIAPYHRSTLVPESYYEHTNNVFARCKSGTRELVYGVVGSDNVQSTLLNMMNKRAVPVFKDA